jgi:hypothetical protein
MEWIPAALSLGVKWLRREADHSHPSSAGVGMREAIPPLPQYAFMVHCLVKQGKFYLYFYSDIFTTIVIKYY